MPEPGRKLFAYDNMCRDPVFWEVIERYHHNHFAISQVTMTLSSASDEFGDTLAVPKNVYACFAEQDMIQCEFEPLGFDKIPMFDF